MADPVTKKIDTLPAMEEPVATNDKLLFLDVSAPAATMTKLITMNQVRISAATQLDANVVENAKIKDGAVTSSKLATGAVTAGKIAAGGVSASSQFAAQIVDAAAIKDGAVTTTKILDGNVTYAKIQKSQNAFVLGNKASTTGTADAIVEIQPSAASQVLLGSTGTTNTVDFGKVTSAHIAAMTSAQLAGVISDETGTGKLVFATSPTLVTPVLGTPASGTLTNCTGLPASGIATMTSADLAGRVSDETGTGKLVFATSPTLTSPTLVTPALGTPASGTLTNCTGLPYSGLVNMTSAQLASKVSDETGTGKLVFATSPTLTSPTLVTPALGTPASGTLTNCTGLYHVVYMQLFLPDEAIITASGRSQFFVPSYLAGGKVKQLGIGIVSASTPSVTVALGSSYGSVSGTSSTETADTLNYTLPSARTKIPINVTCGAGTAPKGLDFWFVVLK